MSKMLSFQDRDRMIDNPYFLKRYQEVVDEAVYQEFSGETINSCADIEEFIEDMWKDYPKWVDEELEYEVFHE